MAVNVFELFAKIGLDTKEYEENLGKSESKFKSFGKALGNGLKTAAKVGTAAIGAATAGVVALTKQAVESYAEYEQLVGGVETLYGSAYESVEEYAKGVGLSLEKAERSFEKYQNRQQDVLNNAANAYKTAGMSANEYMNTVNGFAASLTSSLGEYEWQAANYADMIVTDMADNANKMGTSMESIQNAYSGFAKQNYTMLDNLKLGYGGTKEEMERLLRDAEQYVGYIEGSLDVSNFADVADAIHIVQEQMDITGTTADEAGRTIAGSTSAMKSAWQNLITGIADDNADFGQLIDNFVSSVGTVADNILPRVEIALGGVGQLVSNLVPIIIDEIPKLIETVMPNLITAVSGLVTTLSTTISSNASQMLNSALDLIVSLGGALIQNAPLLVDTVLSLITQLATWVGENVGTFAESAVTLIVSLADSLVANLPEMIPAIISIITNLVEVLTQPDTLSALLEAALAIILAVAEGLISSFPDMIPTLLDVIANIADFLLDPETLTTLVDAAWEIGKMLIEGIWEGVKNLGSWFSDKIKGWFNDTVDDVKEDQEIHSPSRKWARVLGKPMGQGVGVGAVEGLEEAEKLIQGEMDNMTASVTADVNSSYSGAIRTPADQTNELLSEMINLFKSGKAKTNVTNTRDFRSVSYG